MNPYIATAVAVVAAILSGITGWLDTTPVPKFEWRCFLGTLIRAAMGGVGVMTAFIAEPNITAPVGYFIAFGLGAAAEASGKRLTTVYSNVVAPPPPAAKPPES